MAETIAKLVIKKTDSTGESPLAAFLDYGELALNYADGKLFYKNSLGAVATIGELDPDAAKKSDNNLFIGDNTFSGLNSFTGETAFEAGISINILSLTDGDIVWDTDEGNLATVTLTQDSTLDDLINVSPGSYVLRVIQDGTGAHTLSFGTNFKTSEGTAFDIGIDPGSITVITILNAGDGDLYLVGQTNFATIIIPPYAGAPQLLSVTGITGDGTFMGSKPFSRVPDVEGLPAWELLNTAMQKAVISTKLGDPTYYIETYIRPVDPWDPWELSVSAFHNTGGGAPYENGWTNIGAYTGTPVVTVIDTWPAYHLTVTGAETIPGALGAEDDFFLQDDVYTWYGTTPIPPGTCYRCVNPFFPALNKTHLFIALDTVSGNYILGCLSDQTTFDLIEIGYLGAGIGPLGTYSSADIAPPDYVISVTAL